MKKILALALALILVFALLTGCAATPDQTPADTAATPTDTTDVAEQAASDAEATSDKVWEIGYCCANFGTPFQVAIMNECVEALEAYGCFNVDTQDGKDDPVTQTTIVENFITQGKDLIILVPAQSNSLVPVVQECNEANIPVVVINRSLGEGADIITEVNMDCVEAGRLEAQLAVELTGGKGKIAYLLGTLGSGPQVQESEGFYEYLKDYPEIEVVFEQNSDWDKATAIQVAQNMLTKFQAGEIDAVITQGPDDAVGVAEACIEAGRTELLGKITAFDYPSYVKEGTLAGNIYATVNQSPAIQGQKAAEVVYEYFTNPDAKFEALTAIDLPIVTAENCEDYDVAW